MPQVLQKVALPAHPDVVLAAEELLGVEAQNPVVPLEYCLAESQESAAAMARQEPALQLSEWPVPRVSRPSAEQLPEPQVVLLAVLEQPPLVPMPLVAPLEYPGSQAQLVLEPLVPQPEVEESPPPAPVLRVSGELPEPLAPPLRVPLPVSSAQLSLRLLSPLYRPLPRLPPDFLRPPVPEYSCELFPRHPPG